MTNSREDTGEAENERKSNAKRTFAQTPVPIKSITSKRGIKFANEVDFPPWGGGGGGGGTKAKSSAKVG